MRKLWMCSEWWKVCLKVAWVIWDGCTLHHERFGHQSSNSHSHWLWLNVLCVCSWTTGAGWGLLGRRVSCSTRVRSQLRIIAPLILHTLTDHWFMLFTVAKAHREKRKRQKSLKATRYHSFNFSDILKLQLLIKNVCQPVCQHPHTNICTQHQIICISSWLLNMP